MDVRTARRDSDNIAMVVPVDLHARAAHAPQRPTVRPPANGFAPPLERKRLRIYILQMIMDLGIILGTFALASLIYHDGVFASTALLPAQLLLPVFLTVALHNRTYSISSLTDWMTGARKVASALIISALLLNFIAFFAKMNAEFSRVMFAASMVASLILMIGLRFAAQRLMRRLWGPSAINRLIIDGGGPDIAIDGSYRLDAERLGLKPDMNNPLSLDLLALFLKNMDEVVVSCPENARKEWAEILKASGVHGELVSTYSQEVGALGVVHHDDAGFSTLLVSTGTLGLRSRAIKRLLDIGLSSLALLVLSPLLCAIALAIWLEDGNPVLFRQRRTGKGNRLFSIYKFRTMRQQDADTDGKRSTSKDDDRVTRIGRRLRSTSLDELPQLFNVLRGDMSMVGPRPHALGSQAGEKMFWQVDRRYWQRHTLRPGITGLAQVRGLRGATDTESDLLRRLEADLEYLRGWTIWRDIAIIARTAFVLIHKRAF